MGRLAKVSPPASGMRVARATAATAAASSMRRTGSSTQSGPSGSRAAQMRDAAGTDQSECSSASSSMRVPWACRTFSNGSSPARIAAADA